MATPPEGVVTGEDVPRENEADDLFLATVARVAGWLKAHPEFQGRSESELRELAIRYTERMMLEHSTEESVAARVRE
jgi:hypothetical protein